MGTPLTHGKAPYPGGETVTLDFNPTASAAAWSAPRHARGSRGIELLPGALHHRSEVRVIQSGRMNQGDRVTEKRFQSFLQSEERVEPAGPIRGFELDEEIDVAVRRVDLPGARRPKYIQTPDSELPTQLDHLSSALTQFSDHGYRRPGSDGLILAGGVAATTGFTARPRPFECAGSA